MAGDQESKDASHQSGDSEAKNVTDEKITKILKMRENDVKMMKTIEK